MQVDTEENPSHWTRSSIENYFNGGESFSQKMEKPCYFTRATLIGNGLETSQLFISKIMPVMVTPQIAASINGDFKD